MDGPASLSREISPPPLKPSRSRETTAKNSIAGETPAAADIEAGTSVIRDHLVYFSALFRKVLRPQAGNSPRLSIENFVGLYRKNQNENGRHFVIHQHNHPIAGLHYDLRLQFSSSSSISFAIPYGLPGNPNSRRQGRMAIETRVHNVWNHLIESASQETGSLIIWDTGEYQILTGDLESNNTDDEASDAEPDIYQPENQKLATAFQNHSINLRLHGTRLPDNYTVSLRLPKGSASVNLSTPQRKRRRKSIAKASQISDTSDENENNDIPNSSLRSLPQSLSESGREDSTSDQLQDTAEDELTRITNAYPGATNSIGSIHQRRWFLVLDKKRSGFRKEGGQWVRTIEPQGKKHILSDTPKRVPEREYGGFEPFFVRGADFERSVVTGRLSKEVMEDEGVQNFRARKNWMPILE